MVNSVDDAPDHRYPFAGSTVPARQSVTYNTPCGPAQNTLQTGEVVQVDQTTVRGHKLHSGTTLAYHTLCELWLCHLEMQRTFVSQLVRMECPFLQTLIKTIEEPVEVLSQNGCKVSISGGGYASQDHLDHGYETTALADMLEPDFPGAWPGPRAVVSELKVLDLLDSWGTRIYLF